MVFAQQVRYFLVLVVAALLAGCSDDSSVSAAAANDDQVVIEDLVVGTGAAIEINDTILVHYIGYLQSTGDVFDSSLNDGIPFNLVFTATANVIEGWKRGLPGMQAGGRRRLTIPPSLGYGTQGAGNIPRNATLVFVIDLVELKSAN